LVQGPFLYCLELFVSDEVEEITTAVDVQILLEAFWNMSLRLPILLMKIFFWYIAKLLLLELFS
jgi:hypothetical protein